MSQTPTCTRCHRTLRSAVSVAAGIGPRCARRVREVAAAAVDVVKPETVARALEDIEDGAIVDTHRVTAAGRRVFAVLSSTGVGGVYFATGGGACTCKAGLRGKHLCRHAVAAALIAA